MDSFEKLIVDKVNQTQLPDADQAWNDFVKYRERHVAAPKKTSWLFSKISLGIIAVLLLFMGAIGGYEFAQREISSTPVSKSDASTNMKIADSRSAEKNIAIITPKTSMKNTVEEVGSHQKAAHNSVVVPTAFATTDKSIQEESVNIETTNSPSIAESSVPGEPVINSRPTAVLAIDTAAFKATATVSADEIVALQNSQLSEPIQPEIVESVTPAKVEVVENKKSEDKAIAKVESNSGSDNTVNDNSSVSKSSVPPGNSGYNNPNSYAEKGSMRKGKHFNMKEYLSVFNRYTDMSFYSLENTNDITNEMNAKFMVNPANSGIENRYSLIAGAQGDFIQTSQKSLDMQSREMHLGTSFTLANNKVGVGLAIQNVALTNLTGMNIMMSSAYKISLTKNSQLRLGFGVNSSILNVNEPDQPATESSILSFNLGARYMFKSLFAQFSVNNLMPVNVRGNSVSETYLPATAQMSFGGRLFMSKSWAFHPQLTMMASEIDNFKVGLTTSFSCQNKWLMGLQTSDFKSIGIHAGVYASKHFTIIVKSDIYNCSESKSSLLESGELMLKLELGRSKR
jgi:hypothetical protein